MKRTNNKIFQIINLFTLAFLVTVGVLMAQEVETPIHKNQPPVPNEIPKVPEVPHMELPFIDRDSDGINDLLQNGWGLRFVERYNKRQELWNQLNGEVLRGEEGRMVDTDDDGVGDVRFHDFMMEKMNEFIDTDGDGEKDTPLKDYLGGRFKAFDQDGDGLPDDLSAEEIKERMNEMRVWRQEIRERIHKGEAAFVDEDGDGIPDNLPQRFMKRGPMRGPMGGPKDGQN